MTTPHEIADYLASLPRVHSVIPESVEISGKVYPACRYQQTMTTPEHSAAWNRGERNYVQEMIYVVGMLPAVKRNGNVAFTMPGDSRDWYVAGYYGAVKARKQATMPPAEFHPFGNSFLLAPWDVVDSKIDTYERHPYKRVAIDVRTLVR